MKKVFIFIFLSIFIYANEDIEELETIFLKIGVEAFLKDFENEKNITANQQQMIDFLSSKVYEHEMELKKLSENENQKENRVNKNNNFLVVERNNVNLKDLYKKIDKMEKEIKFYKNLSIKNEKKLIELKSKRINIVKNTNTNIINSIQEVLINKDNTVIRAKPFFDAKVLRTLKKSSAIDIESCDKYGWCKLKNEDAYIAKYLLRFKD